MGGAANEQFLGVRSKGSDPMGQMFKLFFRGLFFGVSKVLFVVFSSDATGF
jgi:hypothetical protein